MRDRRIIGLSPPLEKINTMIGYVCFVKTTTTPLDRFVLLDL